MSRLLNDLCSQFKPKAIELIARCAEAGIAVMIVDTLRTKAEQELNIKNGVSWTMNSKHLAQPPEGKSRAIDIVPYQQFLLYGIDKLAWDADWSTWEKIGQMGEKLGLKWGGRWRVRDMSHFEDP